MDSNKHLMEHQNAPITEEWMDSQEFPDDLVTTSGKSWQQREQTSDTAKTVPEDKPNTDQEKSLDEIQEELNEITLKAIESIGISREDYFAWLAEHGIDW